MSETVETPAPATEPSTPPVETPAPEPAPASPPSSRDIVAATLTKLETADAEAQEDAADEAAEAAPPPTTPKPPTPGVVQSVEEQLLEEFGFKEARRPDGREHRIPRSKVLAMIGSGLKRGQAKWEGERTQLTQAQQQIANELEQVRTAVRGDDRAFLEFLSGFDPRYAKYLQPSVSRETAPPADDPMPGPDIDLGNGAKTYSVQGLEAREAWRERQLMRSVEARAAALVEERLKPLTEREAREKAAAETERANQARADEVMAEMQTWPMVGTFAADGSLTPFQAELLEAMKKDTAEAQATGRKRKSAHQVYMSVFTPRYAEDDTAKRARILAEMNGAPKSTSVTPRTVESTRKPGPRATVDVVRETLAKLERGGG